MEGGGGGEESKCMRREKWLRDWNEFDPTKVFPKGSMEEYFQLLAADKKGIDSKEARIVAKLAQLQAMKALVGELPKDGGSKDTTDKVATNSREEMQDMARELQMEAIKTLVCDLRKNVAYDTKGKGKAQDIEVKGKAKAQDVEAKGKDKAQDVEVKGNEKAQDVEAKGKDIATNMEQDVEDVWADDELLFDANSE